MKITKYALLSALITIGSTQAATVVYNFTGDTAIPSSSTTPKTSNATSNDFGPGVMVSAFNINTGARSSITDSHGFAANDMHAYQSWSTGSPTMSLTISVDDTHILDLSSISFLYGVIHHKSDIDGTYTLTSSLGGGTISTHTLDAVGGSLVSDTYTPTLGASFQNLTNTDVTFTWALSNNLGSNYTGDARGHVMDNIKLIGTVSPVPEPSSTALIGLGGLALILRRRK